MNHVHPAKRASTGLSEPLPSGLSGRCPFAMFTSQLYSLVDGTLDSAKYASPPPPTHKLYLKHYVLCMHVCLFVCIHGLVGMRIIAGIFLGSKRTRCIRWTRYSTMKYTATCHFFYLSGVYLFEVI